MLIKPDQSSLLVVDVQDKLLVHVHDWQRILDNVIWLARVAQKVGVPVQASEQYPKGLGHTQADLAALLPEGAIAEKNHFSCVAAQCLENLPGADRPQVVICGIEAHVCVLQTALELLEQGREVFVVADAVSSRRPADRDLALERIRDNGIDIVTREMVCFEWLQQAGTPMFKDISANFLR